MINSVGIVGRGAIGSLYGSLLVYVHFVLSWMKSEKKDIKIHRFISMAKKQSFVM